MATDPGKVSTVENRRTPYNFCELKAFLRTDRYTITNTLNTSLQWPAHWLD